MTIKILNGCKFNKCKTVSLSHLQPSSRSSRASGWACSVTSSAGGGATSLRWWQGDVTLMPTDRRVSDPKKSDKNIPELWPPSFPQAPPKREQAPPTVVTTPLQGPACYLCWLNVLLLADLLTASSGHPVPFSVYLSFGSAPLCWPHQSGGGGGGAKVQAVCVNCPSWSDPSPLRSKWPHESGGGVCTVCSRASTFLFAQ